MTFLAEDPDSGVDDEIASACPVDRLVNLADRAVRGFDLEARDVQSAEDRSTRRCP
jgi:hypothetical protein